MAPATICVTFLCMFKTLNIVFKTDEMPITEKHVWNVQKQHTLWNMYTTLLHNYDKTKRWTRFVHNSCNAPLGNLYTVVNSLRPTPNRRHFADDIFKCISENENEWISPRISQKFVPKVRINNIPALVQIMAWHRPGDRPLSEPMMVSLPTHICFTRPQWVNWSANVSGCYGSN